MWMNKRFFSGLMLEILEDPMMDESWDQGMDVF